MSLIPQLAPYAEAAADQLPRANPHGYNWQHSYSLAPGGGPDRIQLTGDVAKASLPEHRDWQQRNPELAALYGYQGPGSFGTGGYEWGAGIRRTLAGDNMWRRNMQQGLGRGTLFGAGAGLLTGSVLGALIGLLRGDAGQGLRTGAATGVVLGAGLGGSASHNFRKTAAVDAYRYIERLLTNDPALNTGEKLRLQNAVRSLASSDVQSLVRLLQVSGGAGVGALIAKFLFSRGKGGMLLGAVLGGVVTRSITEPGQRNALGQRVRPGLNVYGQRM